MVIWYTVLITIKIRRALHKLNFIYMQWSQNYDSGNYNIIQFRNIPIALNTWSFDIEYNITKFCQNLKSLLKIHNFTDVNVVIYGILIVDNNINNIRCLYTLTQSVFKLCMYTWQVTYWAECCLRPCLTKLVWNVKHITINIIIRYVYYKYKTWSYKF